MPYSRRQFLIASSALLPLAGSLASARNFEPDAFRELRRGVGIFSGKGGTIGWMIRGGGAIVVDSQFPDTAAQCYAGLQQRQAPKLDLLINTHHHFDHTSGNGVFKPHVGKILAHKNVPALQRKAAEERGALNEQVYADATFGEVWRDTVGDETFSARYFGPAHTSGDAVVHFEKADVAHVGDLVFNRIPPYIDRPAGASIQNWIRVLEQVHRTYPRNTMYVFGHAATPEGVVGKREDLLTMRDFLTALLDYTRTGIKEGRPVEEIAKVDRLPAFPSFYTEARKDGIPYSIRIAYEELTAAK